MIMEFDDIKKIWDTQNNQPMYVINEAAFEKTIATKKNKGVHITNISELLSIIVNLGGGTIILLMNILSNTPDLYLYALTAWMMITGIYCLYERMKRIRGNAQFDRTMLGDLDYAISIANYQVRFSGLMRWNILPIGALIILGMWNKENILGIVIGLVLFLGLTFYASGFEHRYYIRRKKDIEELRKILLN